MYDRTREQALAGLLVGWAVLISLATLAGEYQRSNLWHQSWFITCAVVAGIAGLVGVWAVLALIWSRIPFPRTRIPDTHAQHIGLRDLLTTARNRLYGFESDPGDYAGVVYDLIAASLGRADADEFARRTRKLEEWDGVAAYNHIETQLLPRLDHAAIQRSFDPEEWRARIEGQDPA